MKLLLLNLSNDSKPHKKTKKKYPKNKKKWFKKNQTYFLFLFFWEIFDQFSSVWSIQLSKRFLIAIQIKKGVVHNQTSVIIRSSPIF